MALKDLVHDSFIDWQHSRAVVLPSDASRGSLHVHSGENHAPSQQNQRRYLLHYCFLPHSKFAKASLFESLSFHAATHFQAV
jgi:hypothetical protein